MSPPVVSDTSPLVHLARVDLLSLLKVFYDQVLIPTAVWREVVDEGQGRVGEAELTEAVAQGWIQIRRPRDQVLVQVLQDRLDDGEAEAIALATEVEADRVLLDEAVGRRQARAAGLRVVGTLGVLIRARREGRIETLRPILDRLRAESFWISEALYRQALEGVGEHA